MGSGKKFSVIIDEDCGGRGWFVWLGVIEGELGDLGDLGDCGDEYRTKCCLKRKAAIDRMVTMCMGSVELGDDAVVAVREEADRDK